MATNLARILKADLPRAAELIRKKGRGRDTILAHITPREARMLKEMGGSGTTNPDTGLPEFEDYGGFDFNFPDIAGPVDVGIQAQAPMVMPDLTPVTGASFSPDVGRLPGADILGLQEGVQRYAELQPEYYGIPANVMAYSPSETTPMPTPVDRSAAVQAINQATSGGDLDALAKQTAAAYGVDQEGRDPIDLTTGEKGSILDRARAAIAADPLKAGIAALGVGGTGLSYLMAQNQAQSAQKKLQAAYAQAAEANKQLAAPSMQTGGTQLAQALSGQLSPVQRQQLEAARARTAQSAARAGGVGAAQTERAMEDFRQRLLDQQQRLALSLLGAGTPIMQQAIKDQLSGTVSAQNFGMQLSQQAGSAATNMLTMLAMMYGRGR